MGGKLCSARHLPPRLLSAVVSAFPPFRPPRARQGSVVVRCRERVVVKHTAEGAPVERERPGLRVLHTDIIRDAFWEEHPEVLAP